MSRNVLLCRASTPRVGLISAFAAMSCLLSAQPTLVDPNLEAVTAASGFTTPIGIAFLSANDYFVIEKATGQVKRVENGAVTGIPLDLAVNSASERGLLGIALHPGFPLTPYVYLYWTESSTGSDTIVTADTPLLGNRVDRFAWNGTSLAFDRNIVRIRAYQADAGQPQRGNHNGGVIRFGPDGKLYTITGDNGRRGWNQNLILGGFSPDDQFGGPAPDPAHRTGTVMRFNDDGTIPTDNPWNTGGAMTGKWDAMWAYGVRNSFGMAFDPISGQLWTQENGDDTFDEINRVTKAWNGGWIQFMGPKSRVAEFRDIESNQFGGTLQQLRWPPTRIQQTAAAGLARLTKMPGAHYEDPLLSWKYAVAPAGIGFVNTTNLGAEYAGDMFVGAARTNLAGGYLMKLELSANRLDLAFSDPLLNDRVADNAAKFDPLESESLIIGSGFGIVPDIQTSPDGRVFLASIDTGNIYEIRRR